jgi:hypothetical protein
MVILPVSKPFTAMPTPNPNPPALKVAEAGVVSAKTTEHAIGKLADVDVGALQNGCQDCRDRDSQQATF